MLSKASRPPSVKLQSDEAHCSRRIVPAVERRETVRHEVDRKQSSNAEREVLGDLEVSQCAEGDLADAERRSMLLGGQQFPVFRDLPTAKDRPFPMLERGFRDISIVIVVLDCFAAPSECARK